MKVGLFFGTFNPIHVGHLVIADHLAQQSDLDQIWLVVTPQNPLKQKQSLLNDQHRLTLVRIAVEDNPRLKASNIEFDLPKPNYTSRTLAFLKEKYPQDEFALIMGEDNLRTFHKWKNHAEIADNHDLIVYPRVLTESEKEEDTTRTEYPYKDHPRVSRIEAPIMGISANHIRKAIQAGEDVRYLLTEPVYKYVDEMHFYK